LLIALRISSRKALTGINYFVCMLYALVFGD
jgi:hypothetical protein